MLTLNLTGLVLQTVWISGILEWETLTQQIAVRAFRFATQWWPVLSQAASLSFVLRWVTVFGHAYHIGM